MDLLRPVDDLRRRDDIAQPPSGDGIGLGQRRAGQGPLPHPRKGSKVDMPVGRIDDVLIHLIGNHIGIVFLRQTGDVLQLFPGKHPAAGVRRVADDDCLCAVPESPLDDGKVKMVVRRHQRHIDGFRPGEDGIRPVIFVEGGEHQHLVAGIADGHHGAHHGLGGAAGHADLAFGIDGAAQVAGSLLRQGLAEIRGAPGDGILVKILMGHLGKAVKDLLRRVKVRKSLGEVDCPVLQGNPGHAPDDGIRKIRGAFRKTLHSHFSF